MFVGREEQLEQLKTLWRKPVASLVTCRGRRRIGKSTLIEEFARRSHVRFIKIEGVEPRPGVNNETQLKAFARQLAGDKRPFCICFTVYAWRNVAGFRSRFRGTLRGSLRGGLRTLSYRRIYINPVVGQKQK